jgi:NADPH:quinone reductase-like Zn-dependent oxidoreductase
MVFVMKAMAIESYGAVDQLKWVEIQEPTPAPDEVRVRVRASAINPADIKVITGEVKLLHGRKFPLVVGYDYAGEIDAVGQNVKGFKMGDRVFGFLPYSGKNNQGAFSEKIVVGSKTLSQYPITLSFEEAASIPTTALTALRGLRVALGGKLKPHILVNGASGGVGSSVVQIARIMGAQVTATCSESSKDYVKSLGAEEVIDYRKTPVLSLGKKYSAIYDVASNLSFFKARSLLLPGGHFVSLLPSPSVIGGIILSPFMREKCSLIMTRSINVDLKQISGWLEEKRLKPSVDKVFTWQDLVKAIQYFERGGIRGKVAITVN